MPFSKEKRTGTILGIIFVAIFAAVASQIASIESIATLGISPLVVGIVLGIVFANTLRSKMPQGWNAGIVFSAKKILRFAIVFYGFRITFQQISSVGMEGFMVSLIMLSSTMILGIYIGRKIFKMDMHTSILTASGASVCGAAAVLATEPVLKSEPHKTAIAVSMVVLFGTIAMFLYPVLYTAGVFDMTNYEFGIYVGGTIHEVAQVVAVGGAFGQEAADNAVIVKMTRVMMIAPMLIVLGIILSYQAKKSGKLGAKVAIVIPWFAVYFVGVSGINSLGFVPLVVVDNINAIDTFLLTMSMTALGMETMFSKFKGLGLAPLYTALVMFAWLVIGGYFITKWVVAIF
jgi:uncharacterized integral membrane protein (TIGR00698 family)